MPNRLDIIDMSHHNLVKDFAAIKQAGVLGMIHKATEGGSYKDPKFEARRAGCREAGLFFASYHFFRPGDPKGQMKLFSDTSGPDIKRLVIDYEDDRCSLANLCTAIQWLRTNRPECGITVYGGHVIKEQFAKQQWYDVDALNATDFWIAHYTSADKPVWPSQWPEWKLWQYSDGNVGGQPRLNVGVGNDTDCNMFNGDRSEIEGWFYPVSKAPEQPAPEKSAVTVNIDVEGADTVHVVVNGKQII